MLTVTLKKLHILLSIMRITGTSWKFIPVLNSYTLWILKYNYNANDSEHNTPPVQFVQAIYAFVNMYF